jgi:mono/diheme cytochrome c family protein
MMRRIAIMIIVLAVLGAGLFWFITRPAIVSASALPARTPNLENGKTMLYAGGCPACHAPDENDLTRLGGGAPLKFRLASGPAWLPKFLDPVGTFYPPNISPDPNDGIGRWSEADFVSALLKGTSDDGEHLYPAFPYTSYQRMKVEDARDLFAYLKTVPAVQGKARDHDLPIYFKIRPLVGGWKFLYLDGQEFKPDRTKSEQWNRGAYLANGPAHCAECHSPRNFLGAIIADQRFSGGPDPEGGDGWIPNITPVGIGDYSERDIARILERGKTPDGDSVGGAMAKVVRDTSRLSDADRDAIAVYIKSLPPIEGLKPPNSGS